MQCQTGITTIKLLLVNNLVIPGKNNKAERCRRILQPVEMLADLRTWRQIDAIFIQRKKAEHRCDQPYAPG
jgi:hypothetical protein